MMHRPSRLLLLALTFLAGAASSAMAVEVQRVISPGGIEAWLVEEHAVPILSVRYVFRGGSKLDPRGKEGLATLVSGLLNEGAGDLNARAFQHAVDDNAVRMSFDAGLDGFGGSLQTLTERRDAAFSLLALALTRPRFDRDAVERVRQQLLRSLERATTNADSIARKTWFRAVFAEHPYGRPRSGTPAGVQAVERADLAAFVRRHFTRDRLVIGVAGDIDAATLGPLLDATFGALPETAPDLAAGDTEPVTELAARGKLIIERQPQPQSVVFWGQRGPGRDDPDYYAIFVMNRILGGAGFTSRLYDEVREKRGLAYSVQTWLALFENFGLFMGSVATQNDRVAETLDVIRAEFERMRDEGVSEEELQDAKTWITGSFPLNLDSNNEVASILVSMQLSDLGIDYLDHRDALIGAVTREDVLRVARELIDPDSFTVVVVGEPMGLAASDG